MSQWIRTMDRIPPDNAWVIVAVKDSRGRKRVGFGYHVAGSWYSTDDYPLESAPEHWMPMPNPPEE